MVKKIVIMLSLFLFVSHIVSVEKKFVIVITSYNNADWCVKNLEMIFCQTNPENTGPYENYRVIVIDDASVDGNAEFIERYIYACNQQHRVTLIKNKTRKRALANLYLAVQLCEPDEIVFNHDGDDWLSDDRVFDLINSIYQNPDIWITYGSFINWPTNQMGYCKPVSDEMLQNKWYRKKWWMPGQLRTFYAWLFNQVQLKDLLFEGPYFQGQFFPANSDLAIYYPMMEMAGTHFQFIPDLIYIRNVATPINDFKANKDVQVLGSKIIREKEIYPTLDTPRIDYFKKFENKTADIVFFSHMPSSAQKFITSVERLVKNCGTIYIFYSSEANYQNIKSALTVRTIKLDSSFKQSLHTILSSTSYIMFAHDGHVISRYIDYATAITTLEKTFAYAVYLMLDPSKNVCMQTGMPEPIPALNEIGNDVYAWAFGYADSGDWRSYNTCECALYRTRDILEQIKDLAFNDDLAFKAVWQQVPINLEQVGLCYEHAKVNYVSLY